MAGIERRRRNEKCVTNTIWVCERARQQIAHGTVGIIFLSFPWLDRLSLAPTKAESGLPKEQFLGKIPYIDGICGGLSIANRQ